MKLGLLTPGVHVAGVPAATAQWAWPGAGSVAPAASVVAKDPLAFISGNGTAWPTWVRGPASGSWAVYVNGSTTAAACPDSPRLRPARSITLAAWLRADTASPAQYGTVVAKEFSNPRSPPYISYKIRGEGNWSFEVGQGSNESNVNSGVSVVPGRWVHVVAVWSPNSIQVYVDGRLRASGGGKASVDYGNGRLLLGMNESGGERWAGALWDVRLYDVALTPAQVASLFFWSQLGYPAESLPLGRRPFGVGGGHKWYWAGPRYSGILGSGVA